MGDTEKINYVRVIGGGLVAGIINDILGYLVDGVMLSARWAFAMRQLGRSEFSLNQMIGFNILGLAWGIFAVWLYAAIRPRYGAGPKTAVCAGLAVWAIGTLLPNAGFWLAGVLPRGLTVLTTGGGIVEAVVAVLAGAALYQEVKSPA
jgi:hypothetical protein